MKFITSILSILNFLASPLLESTQPEETAIVVPSVNDLCVHSVEIKNKHTLITLSNGTLWRYDDVDLFQDNGWHLQDRVSITYVHFDGYFLENQSFQGAASVKLLNRHSNTIQTRRISYISPDYDMIHLDDNSEWHIGWWSGIWIKNKEEKRAWQQGDRVLTIPSKFIFGDANYLLVNLDKPFKEDKHLPSNARARLDSKPYVMNAEDPMRRSINVWYHRVTNVRKTPSHRIITLNNATEWICDLNADVEYDHNVRFCQDSVHGDTLVLKNMYTLRTAHCALKRIDSQQVLTIQNISRAGCKIELSDGSIWTIGWMSSWTTSDWKCGDFILVSMLEEMATDMSSHRLINLNRLDKTGKLVSMCHVQATLLR